MSDPYPTIGSLYRPRGNEAALAETLEDRRWRELRASLATAGTILIQASQMITTEDVRPMLGLASRETMHAALELALIERDRDNQPLEGVEP